MNVQYTSSNVGNTPWIFSQQRSMLRWLVYSLAQLLLVPLFMQLAFHFIQILLSELAKDFMELSHCPTKSQPRNKRSTEHFIPTHFFQKQCPFVSINSQIEFDPNSTIQYYYVALQIRSPYPDRDKNVPTLNSIDIICHPRRIICHPRRNENIWELY